MVAETKGDYPSEFAAIESVARKLGIGSAETLRKWIRRAEVDAGQRPGVTTAESEQIKALKRENAELRRANEILKSASAFFAAELDRPHRYLWTTSPRIAVSSGSSRSAGCCPSSAARSPRPLTTPRLPAARPGGRSGTSGWSR